jgi:hypothetical protein
MLVQQPDTEAMPCIALGQILAQLVQTGAIVVAQDTDIGGVHVRQHRVVLNAVIPHRQHIYLLILEENSVHSRLARALAAGC